MRTSLTFAFFFSRSTQPPGSRQVPSLPGRYMTNISETDLPQQTQVVHMKSIKTKKEYALSDEETIPLKNQ